MNSFSSLSRLQQFLAILIFLFPAFAITVRHAGTTVYVVLFLTACLTVIAKWQSQLQANKKKIILVAISLTVLSFSVLNYLIGHIASAILVFLFLATCLALLPEWKSLPQVEKNILFGFVAFSIMLLISLLMSDDVNRAYRLMESPLRILFMLPIFFMFRQNGFDYRGFLLWGLCLGGGILAGQAVYDIYYLKQHIAMGVYFKIDFGDGAALTALLLVVMVISMAEKYRNNYLLYTLVALSLVSALYAMVMSGTRGAWLFFIIATLLLFWIYRQKILGKYKRLFGVVVIVLVVLLGVGVFDKVVKGFEQGIQDIKGYVEDPRKPSSWGLRLNMWRDSWAMLKSAPLLGIGAGDYKYVTLKMMDEKKSFTPKWFIPGDAHNQYVNSLATTGVIGFVLLLLAFFILPGRYFYAAWKNTDFSHSIVRYNALAGMTLLLAYAVFAIGFPWLDVNNMMNQYCFYLALFMAGVSRSDEPRDMQ